MGYQSPRGTNDILPNEMQYWHHTEAKLKEIASLYQYEELRTPYFEDTKVFKRENDSSDMVNKEMYTFAMGKESYTLRPEGTAGIIRAFNQHKFYGGQELPGRYYYMGAMFRHERPQKGRYRQFHQFGIENIGAKSPALDVETIALGYQIVKEMDIQSIKVLINTLGDDESRAAYRQGLKEYFAPHVDSLCDDCKRRYEQNPLRILDCKVDHDHPSMQDAPRLEDYLNDESKAYFKEVLDGLEALGIPYEVDDRLVRGLDYYTHTVFEVVSTRPESGAQATIFAGGRYDHFVSYYGGPDLSGIGFAIGMERLIELAKQEGHDFGTQETPLVYMMGIGNVTYDVLRLSQHLRNQHLLTACNLLPRSMKAQFKSADRQHAKYIVILGEEEVLKGTCNLKNTLNQKQVTIPQQQLFETIMQWEGEQ